MKCSWFSREGLTAALPPNVEAGRMAGIIRGTLLGAVFGGGILFACRYGSAYQSLMEWDPVRNRSVVRAGARMLPFWQTMEPALVLMALFALGALLSATVLYASYYQGGRSTISCGACRMAAAPCAVRCGRCRCGGWWPV